MSHAYAPCGKVVWMTTYAPWLQELTIDELKLRLEKLERKLSSEDQLYQFAVYCQEIAGKYETIHNYRAAYYWQKIAVDRARKLFRINHQKYTPVLVDYLNNLGCLLALMGKFKSALKVITGVLNLSRKFESPPVLIAQTLTNLGNVYFCLKKPEKALEAYKEALKIYADNPSSSPGSCLSNVITVFESLGQEKIILRIKEDFTSVKMEPYVTVIYDLRGIIRTIEKALEERPWISKSSG